MDVKEFRDIVVPRKRVFLAKGCSDSGRLLLYEGTFIGNSLKFVGIRLLVNDQLF
jgi:hypothetical protein